MSLLAALALQTPNRPVASPVLSSPGTFYVATNGNDAWSGRLAEPNAAKSDGPWRNLSRAQTALRGSPTKKVTVRSGRYSFKAGLALTWQDNGEQWTTLAGERVVLDGAGSGVVGLTGVKQFSFEGFTLQNLGVGGVVVNGANEITFRWNRWEGCEQECLTASALTKSILDSNTFREQRPGNPPGTKESAYSAVRLGYGSSHNRITHNLIENCEGGGIAFATGPKDPPNSGNIVDRNTLRNIDRHVVDMGAIYFYDTSRTAVGNEITNNIITENGGADYMASWTKSIYLDDGTSHVLVSGNVCRNCGRFAWQIHGGDHNTIINNIFDLAAPDALLGLYQTNPKWKDAGMTDNVVKANIVYFEGAVPSSLYQVNIRPGAALPVVEGNLYYARGGAPIPNVAPIVDAKAVYADPGLTHSAAMIALPALSPAYRLIPFRPLPNDQGPLAPTVPLVY